MTNTSLFHEQLQFNNTQERTFSTWLTSCRIGMLTHLFYLPQTLYKVVIVNFFAGMALVALNLATDWKKGVIRCVFNAISTFVWVCLLTIRGLSACLLFIPVLGCFGFLRY